MRLFLGTPVLFRQPRPGRQGRVFVLIKFRTMRVPEESENALQTDAVRLTWLGRWLRALSLDELPELWNILKGEMSFVGPRPLLVSYLERYNAHQARRHEVRPGLTGWAQVNGRNAQSWQKRLDLDVWYVDHWSLWLDAKIILRTVIVALQGQGSLPMDEFKGNL